MKKRKPTGPEIASWEEADIVLANVAECRQALAEIAAESERTIEAVKSAAKSKARPYNERLAAGLAALEAFTKGQEPALEGRSKRLTHGRVGFRKASKIVLFRTVKFVLDALKADGFTNCIRTKEEVDKEAMDRFSEPDLKTFGCRRQESDVFFAETDEVIL